MLNVIFRGDAFRGGLFRKQLRSPCDWVIAQVPVVSSRFVKKVIPPASGTPGGGRLGTNISARTLSPV
jgi:hypothetical protein